MARSSRQRGSVPFSSAKYSNFNDGGGGKRRRKQKGKEAGTADDLDELQNLYEDIGGRKGKRSQTSTKLTKEELKEMGEGRKGSDDDEGTTFDGANVERIGNMEEDGVVNEEDDEEIESDEAFGESDEEQFSAFFGDRRQARRSRTANDEEDEDEDAEDIEGMVDLSEMLNDAPEDTADTEHKSMEKPSSGASKGWTGLDGEISDGGEEEDMMDENEDGDDDDEEEEDVLAPSEDDVDDGELDALGVLIERLPVGKRKADDENDKQRARKRRILERTEVIPEGEYGAPARSGEKIRAEDLFASLRGPSTDKQTLKLLKKSTKALASTKTTTQPLPAPLPLRLQERIDRQAAYQQTKQEVEKWTPAMKAINEAQHLSFPLQAIEKAKPSTAELVATFKPTTSLESSIDRLLKAGNARAAERGEDEEEGDPLKPKELSLDEIKSRRLEIRRAKALMDRAQVKAARVAKIKSKTYRKLRRKQAEKSTLTAEELDTIDPELAEAERMRLERARAEERASLRHKNGAKWTKSMKGDMAGNMDKRRNMEEMLQRGEDLRRKIAGKPDSEAEEEDGESEEDENAIKLRAFDQLDELDQPNREQATKGVFGMKFMREAMARRMEKANDEADDFKKELGDLRFIDGDDDDVEQIGEPNGSTSTFLNVGGNKGRFVYQPNGLKATDAMGMPTSASHNAATSHQEAIVEVAVASMPPPSAIPKPSAASDTSSVTMSSSAHGASIYAPPDMPSDISNPWLAPINAASGSTRITRKKNEVVVSKSSTLAIKSTVALKKDLSKTAAAREREKDDATVEISLDSVMTISPASAAPASKTGKSPGPASDDNTMKTSEKPPAFQAQLPPVDDNGDNTTGWTDVKPRTKKKDIAPVGASEKGRTQTTSPVDAAYQDANDGVSDQGLDERGIPKLAMRQRDLVAQAFAGDNVIEDFEAEKQREIERLAPQEVNTFVPGWGAWTGAGLRKKSSSTNPKFIKKTSGIEAHQRKDYGKKHVIISERKDVKAAKYQIKDLPFPYTSRAQYEKSMEVPLGTEWNTRTGHLKATLPRVTKKMGVVIEPLERLF
ncbi:hypothetical protein FRB96_006977 [Tulasnella sp. 330]|nr:hypothetical protein FRB96_006977 [Tulasnella sp. 330]KAG8883815.1 hypothetical protein FRB97_005818 [Tulasnella sp. 331]